MMTSKSTINNSVVSQGKTSKDFMRGLKFEDCDLLGINQLLQVNQQYDVFQDGTFHEEADDESDQVESKDNNNENELKVIQMLGSRDPNSLTIQENMMLLGMLNTIQCSFNGSQSQFQNKI